MMNLMMIKSLTLKAPKGRVVSVRRMPHRPNLRIIKVIPINGKHNRKRKKRLQSLVIEEETRRYVPLPYDVQLPGYA